MQCRNCRCYLDNDCRYCPRCGAPISVWPAAGAPWLRRPAAVATLAIVLVAWLAALQRQLWLSTHRPPHRPAAWVESERIATLSPAHPPAVSERREERVTPTERAPNRRASREVTVHQVETGRWTTDRPEEANHRLALRSTTEVRRTPSGWAWADGTVLPHSDEAAPVPPRLASTTSRVPVVGAPERPGSRETFVYLNGGRLLGRAPLPVQFDQPGRYRLLFWTPAQRRHEMRVVEIASRGRQWIHPSAGRPLTESHGPRDNRGRPEPRKEVRGTVMARSGEPSPRPARPSPASPWSRPPVPARYAMADPSQIAARPADLVVNISARPYGVKTFVYLNGGRLLGAAPLPVQFDRPGRYRLLFWSPTLRRQVTRSVEVTGRGRQWVSATMGPSRVMARGD